MAWPKFGHVIYFLIWPNLFPFLVSGEGGSARPYPNKKTLCTRIFFCIPLGTMP
jgi:hypothetical protein